MDKKIKLNVLLAITESLAPNYKGMIADYSKFFKNSQGAFLGSKNTYNQNEGTIDQPNKRSVALVQTTVDEKLEWFVVESKNYIDALFSQEATNASGVARADLIVDGENWGNLSSLELLRLKNIVGSGQFETMLRTIPVRSDAEEWSLSNSELYGKRSIHESPLVSGISLTSVKEDYILDDPNKSEGRTPQVASKTTLVELGTTTVQKFSGQWSQRDKADALRKRTNLLVAITKALKECNDVNIFQSEITSDKIFNFLFD